MDSKTHAKLKERAAQLTWPELCKEFGKSEVTLRKWIARPIGWKPARPGRKAGPAVKS